MTTLRNTEAQAFLEDFEKSSETIILEEGAKTSELSKIAKAKGMDTKSRDLGFFKTIYAFTNKANANGAILPEKKLIKVLPQIIGKPININHNRNIAIGHYIDYRYVMKDKTIVAYGVFYKTYFGELWDEAKSLFKSKKLSTSFEIWSPQDTRREHEDGTYELTEMEMAGGALVYEDKFNKPAFKDAKVLELAQRLATRALNSEDLVFATDKKYKSEDLILAEEEIKETISKIKCSNCSEEFELKVDARNKCPKCFSILDKEGTMIYPPQNQDFKVLCPSCQTRNWLILSKTDKDANIKCNQCSKEYKITFSTKELAKDLKRLSFLYSTSIKCPQCGRVTIFSGVSSVKETNVKCKSCGLEYPFDIDKSQKYKNISSIEEIIDKEDSKTDNKGGNEMEQKKDDVKKVEETIVDVKLVEKSKETKQEVEEKKEDKPETSSEETSKKDAPTEEEKKVEEKVSKEKESEKTIAIDSDGKVKLEEIAKAEVEEKKDDAVEEKSEVEEPKEEKSEVKESDKEEKVEDNKEKEVKDEKSETEESKKEEEVVDKYPKTKILRKAVSKMKTLEEKSKLDEALKEEIKTLKSAVKKLAQKLIDSREEKTLYESNAKKIIERRNELEDYKKDELKDVDLLNDETFEKAKLEKASIDKNTTTEEDKPVISTKVKGEDFYSKKRSKVDEYIANKLKQNKTDLEKSGINVD